MYFCDEIKLGFIHVPKTGGTFLKKNVLALRGMSRIGHKHSGMSDLLKDTSIGREDYFYFAFVRNPYQRLVSSYRFDTRERGRLPPEKESKRVKLIWDDFPSYLRTIQKLKPGWLSHRKWVAVKESIPKNLTLYRFEDFNDSITDICRRFDIPVPDLERRGEFHYMGAYDYRDYLCDESLKIIHEENEWDFQHLGYDKL